MNQTIKQLIQAALLRLHHPGRAGRRQERQARGRRLQDPQAGGRALRVPLPATRGGRRLPRRPRPQHPCAHGTRQGVS